MLEIQIFKRLSMSTNKLSNYRISQPARKSMWLRLNLPNRNKTAETNNEKSKR